MTDKLKKQLTYLVNSFNSLPFWVKTLVTLSIIIGSGFRYYNLFNLGYHFDLVYTQYNWGKAGYEMGIINFWKDYTGFFDYSLLSLIFEAIIYAISKPFGGSDYAFVVVLKSFNWLVEILFSAYLFNLVYKYSTDSETTKRIKAFALVAFSYVTPALWFVTGVWGQNDTLIAFLSAISLEMIYSTSHSYNFTKKLSWAPKPVLNILNNKFFWSGVVLAISFWIKQQAILVVPILALYHLKNKSWEDIRNLVIWSIPFGVLAMFAFDNYYHNQWDNTFKISVGFLVILTFSLLAFVNKKDSWKEVRMQGFGFYIVSILIIIPCAILNYHRLGSTLFAVVGRQNTISNGAVTVWRLLDMEGNAGRNMFEFGGRGFLTVSTVGMLIYIMIMVTAFVAFQKLNLKQLRKLDLEVISSRFLDFKSALILTTISSSAYFIFFTKMHSRYLHFGIVFGLLSLAVINAGPKFYKWLWLTIIIQLAYLVNQMSVYADQISNSQNTVRVILASVNHEYWNLLKLCSLVLLVSFIGLFDLSKDIFADKTSEMLDKK